MIRSYTKLIQYRTFEDRFHYLALRGAVAERTFGSERYLNQQFYRSTQWRTLRNHVLARDNGCDLGIEGYEINDRPMIHHMNPMTRDALVQDDESILDPEFLITVSHKTHNAIHYGDGKQLPRRFVERRPGDTVDW